MPGKSKTRRTRKVAAVRAVAGRKLSTKKAVEMTAEEVASLELVAARHAHSEEAWQKMTALPADEDRWSAVEEHLLAKPHEHDHSLRRWKYFSK